MYFSKVNREQHTILLLSAPINNTPYYLVFITIYWGDCSAIIIGVKVFKKFVGKMWASPSDDWQLLSAPSVN